MAAEGPVTEKLLEDVKQEATQSVSRVTKIRLELGDLRSRIAISAE